jgi:ATP-dependent RNA helicase DDX41
MGDDRIPPFLANVEDPNAGLDMASCTYCGGLGHTIANCPKRADAERRTTNAQKGDRDWGRGDF